jgi:hypothetical protein
VNNPTTPGATASTEHTGPTHVTTVSIPDGKDEDFLTLGETAAILRIPVSTLRWWRQRGDGPHFFKLGRHLLTTIGDLRAWIEEQKHGGPDAA